MAKNQDSRQHSLFSSESVDRAGELLRRQQAEERRRRQLLLRAGMPLLLILLGVSGWLLRRPIRAIFTYKQIDYTALQQEHDADLTREQSAEPTAEQVAEAAKATKVYGNPSARMVITMRFESELMSPEGLIALAHDAVDSKPSEVCLQLAYRPPLAGEGEDGEISLNGSRMVVLRHDGESRELALAAYMREEDFVAVLDQTHAEIYGRGVCPLRVSLPEGLRERRRQQVEAALPAVVPEHQATATEANAGDNRKPALVLPDLKVTLE